MNGNNTISAKIKTGMQAVIATVGMFFFNFAFAAAGLEDWKSCASGTHECLG